MTEDDAGGADGDRPPGSPGLWPEPDADVIDAGPPRRQLPRGLVVGVQVVVVAAALVWGVVALTGGESVDPAGPAVIAAPIDSPAASPHVVDTREPGDLSLRPRRGGMFGRESLTVDGIHLSYRLPKTYGWRVGFGWNRYNSHYMSADVVNSQEAEAVVYWTSLPVGGWGHPCKAVLDLSAGASTTEVVDAISSAPGTELVAGPTPVTVGGHGAQQIVLTVGEDAGCDPGYFFRWRYVYGGPFWAETGVGDTIRVWVVADYGGRRLLIVGETTWDAGHLDEEVLQIVDSIRFPRDPADWVGAGGECAVGCR